MNKRKTINTAIFVFMSMIAIAIAENVRGVFIPTFKTEFHVNDLTVSYMITAASIAYVIATYIGGTLSEKIGQKKVFLIGLSGMIVTLVALAFTKNYIVFLIIMFLSSGSSSLIDISVNTMIPVLFLSSQAIFMNLTHFFYGVGATFSQRASGLLLYNGVSWRTIYLMIAALIIILFIYQFFIHLPEIKNVEEKKTINYKVIFRNKLLYYYIIGLGFYIAAEVCTGNWYVNFMESYYKFNKDASSFYLALFFGTFTIGRLVGGFVVEKLGKLNTVIFGLIMALIIFTSGLALGSKGILLISISGFFFSIAFPTIVLTISSIFKENASYVTGLIITLGTTINMFINLLIGFMNDKVGTYNTFYVIPACLIIAIIFIILINRELKRKV